MIITFDVLDRFQESKVWQTAQTMNNILKSNKNGSFVAMETVTSLITNSEKCLFDLNHSNSVVKTKFFLKRTSVP